MVYHFCSYWVYKGQKVVEMGVQDLCGVGIMAPSGRGLPRKQVGERQKDWQQLAGLSLPQSASLTAPSQREPFTLHTLARPYPAVEESAAGSRQSVLF